MNPFDDSEKDKVKEGFLCPICLRDLGDVLQLQAHFAEGHPQTSSTGGSDHAELALHQLKDLFGRAKQRILKFESALSAPQQQAQKFDDEQAQISAGQQTFFDDTPPAQHMGPTTDHSLYLKRIRDARIDQATVETNRLIIRLDKLISDAPTDASKRKGILQETFEKETVQWANDADVQYCRDCGGKFTLTKRRHHCRLCGKIVCAPCSQFLTFAYARKLTNPAYAAAYQAEAESSADKHEGKNVSPANRRLSSGSSGSPNTQIKTAGEKLLSTLATKLKRDGSEVSLSSLFSQEGEDQLRICKECKHLLQKRDAQVELRTQPPIITQMYERLRSSMEEAERLFPSYCKMAESLSIGESVYDLETAKDMRLRLLKIQEQIDFLSKKIASLGASDGQSQSENDTSVSPRQRLLQRNVRQFAAAFLQDIAYNTPALPTPSEYEKLKAEYKLMLQQRIERERAMAAAAVADAALAPHQGQKHNETGPGTKQPSPHRQPSPESHYRKKFGRNEEAGWTPDTSTMASSLFRFNALDDEQSIDPLREQILLIKGYIKQAALAGRSDEVKLLERNLRELEEELKLQNTALTPRTGEFSPA